MRGLTWRPPNQTLLGGFGILVLGLMELTNSIFFEIKTNGFAVPIYINQLIKDKAQSNHVKHLRNWGISSKDLILLAQCNCCRPVVVKLDSQEPTIPNFQASSLSMTAPKIHFQFHILIQKLHHFCLLKVKLFPASDINSTNEIYQLIKLLCPDHGSTQNQTKNKAKALHIIWKKISTSNLSSISRKNHHISC